MVENDIPRQQRSIPHFLRLHAQERPEKRFADILGDTLTFGQLKAEVWAVARGLARRGVGIDGRVMILAPNCIEWVVSWFASSVVGAAMVPVNPAFKGALLEYMFIDARPDTLVVHASLLENLAALKPEVLPPRIFVIGDLSAGSTNAIRGTEAYAALHTDTGPDPEAPFDPYRLLNISYTSGTTGPSKGVMSSTVAGFCSTVNFRKVTGMQPEDSIYAPLPLFHSTCSKHGVMSALVWGSTITIDEKFSASRYWERAAQCNATIALSVTVLTSVLLAQTPKPSDRQHRVRVIFNSKYSAEFEDRFNVRTVEAFAMTEVGQLIHSRYPERRPGSMGQANPQWELQLVDAEDRPVEQGHPGELVCRPRVPDIMMTGYLNKPDVTLEAFRNLWFHTGDVMRQDDDGYFYFIDRKKDRIRRRGENVSSVEVELLVVAHPDVQECAVVPYPADDGEDDIRVLIVPKQAQALDASAVYAWMKDALPKFMLPRYVEIVDSLPRNGTGKVEKFKIIQGGLGAASWDAATVDPGRGRRLAGAPG